MKGNCDKITCQICQQEMGFGRIQRHIKSKHKDIEYQNYVNSYWKTLPLHKPCEICNKNIVYKYKTCSKECHSTITSEALKGIPKLEGFMSKEHRQKLSKSHLGKIIPKEVGDKISKSSQGVSRNKGKTPMLGKKHSQKTIIKMSDTAKKQFDEGKRPFMGRKGINLPLEQIEKIIKSGLFKNKNKLEQKFADLLSENNIEFKYSYFLKNKEICKQFDFKIKDQNILIEIDGDYWHGNPETTNHCKHVEQVQNNDIIKGNLAKDSGFVLLRFWEKDVKDNPNLVLDKLKEIITWVHSKNYKNQML